MKNETVISGSDSLGPQFEHDCDHCVFLGRWTDPETHTPYDLYFHPSKEAFGETVIARFGSDGPEYASGTPFSFGRIKSLTIARLRAQEKGLYSYNVYQAAYELDRSCELSRNELAKALPFTPEYQAMLAMEAGNTLRARGLVAHMIQRRIKLIQKYLKEGEDTSSKETLVYRAIAEAHDLILTVVSAYREIPKYPLMLSLAPLAEFGREYAPTALAQA